MKPAAKPTNKPAVAHTVAYNSIEAQTIRGEHEAVRSAFVAWARRLREKFGWDAFVALHVMQRLTLAYEIGAELRESRIGGGLVGEKLSIPPELLRVLYALCCEARALTGDIRAVVQVKYAFHAGWKRNRRGNGGAPKMTAGSTVIELMKRTEKTESDARYRYRARVRLKKMTEEFHRK